MRIDFGDKCKMQRCPWVLDDSKRIKHHWTTNIISDMCHSLAPDSCFVYGCSSSSLSYHGKKLKALYCDSIPGSPWWHMPDHATDEVASFKHSLVLNSLNVVLVFPILM